MAVTIAELRQAIVAGCPGLTAIPAGEKTRAEVERLWARDRAALGKCGLSYAGFIALVEKQNRSLEKSGN